MQKTIFTLFVFFICLQNQALATSLKGFVLDAGSGDALIGANLYIKELNITTISGLDGSYWFSNVPKGNYTLLVKYLGYNDLEEKITLDGEEPVSLNIHISPKDLSLVEIIVRGNGSKNTELSARESERKSVNIINVVSAHAIQISPDLQISNVVQRVSGVTLESGNSGSPKYTIMRGMDKRYNYSLINGVKIPSTNNQHRYISLDLFPADMVDRVEVKKALTPDLEGDAIAGMVNMEMKNAPERFHVQANVGAGINFLFSNNDFKTFDTKVLNKKSPYELNGSNHYATPAEFPKKNLDFQTSSLPIDQTAGLTIGNRFFKKKLGVMVSGSYLKQFKGDKRKDFSADVEKNNLATLNLPTLTDYQESFYYDKKINLGLHGRLDYQLNRNNSIKLYSAYIDAYSTQIRETDDTNLEVSYDPANGSISRTHDTRFRYNTQNLFTHILQGKHALLGSQLVADWSVVYSKASNLTPDEASITYGANLQNYQPYNWFVDFDGSKRLWRHNTDTDKTAYLNFKYSFYFPHAKSAVLKFGGLYRLKSRTSFYNSYTLQAVVKVNTPDTSYTSFYSEYGKDWRKYSDINWRVYNPRGAVATGENFESHENVAAGYGMFDVQFSKLQIVGGIRAENTDQGYFMEFPIGQPRPDGNQNYTDFLPSLHFNYGINSTQNLRFSYYSATNKPGFLELVPCPVVDANDNRSKGNPDLLRAIAHNLDLRWEYFPRPLDQLLIGVFYKNIKHPIEYAFVREGSSQDIYYSPTNSDKAINMGAEIDLIKYFREFGIRGNYTFTSSNITTTKLLYTRDGNGNLVPKYDQKQSRPLFGQSRHVYNISLLYKGIKNNINAQLAFSYTGDRIYTVSRFFENDYWQKGFLQMDASITKSFNNGISLYAKANNLLNTRFYGYIPLANAYNSQFPDHTNNDKNTEVRTNYAAQTIIIGIRFNL